MSQLISITFDDMKIREQDSTGFAAVFPLAFFQKLVTYTKELVIKATK